MCVNDTHSHFEIQIENDEKRFLCLTNLIHYYYHELDQYTNEI